MVERLTYRQISDEGWRIAGEVLLPPARLHWVLRALRRSELIDGVPKDEFRAVRSQVLDHLAACDTLTEVQRSTLRRAGWRCGEDSRWHPAGDAEAVERRLEGDVEVVEMGLTANDAWRVQAGYGCLLVG